MIPPNSTFRRIQHSEYFFSEVLPSCDTCYHQEVFVGRTKEALDVVDSELIIGDIAQVFGPYVKFIVEEADGEV